MFIERKRYMNGLLQYYHTLNEFMCNTSSIPFHLLLANHNNSTMIDLLLTITVYDSR